MQISWWMMRTPMKIVYFLTYNTFMWITLRGCYDMICLCIQLEKKQNISVCIIIVSHKTQTLNKYLRTLACCLFGYHLYMCAY